MSSDLSGLKCPYCGSSDHIKRKGFRHNKSQSLQLYLCKSCNRRFPENARKLNEVPDDLAATYLFDVTSLESFLRINKNLTFSRTTLYRRIRKQAKQCPNWEELVQTKRGHANWGSVMGIDTTCLKIKGAGYVYLHIADVLSHDPLAYVICTGKDAATIEPILQKLKSLGYYPKIVVSDLAPEILISVRNVFPNVILQGCIFHVRLWLNKELPTRKRIKDVRKERVVLWRKAKDLTYYACVSKDKPTREQYLKQLGSLAALDEKVKSVVERFSENLKYYHTGDEFQGYSRNILYDNLCECHIGMITRLQSKFMGFKGDIETTNNIIKLFWYHYRKSPTTILTKEEDASLHYLPLTLFCDCVNIPEFSKASGISKESLIRSVSRIGLTLVGEYAFAENRLKEIQRTILNMGRTSLDILMEEVGFDQTTTIALLEKFGIGFAYRSLDPTKVIIFPARHE